jgi:hypothetical protein
MNLNMLFDFMQFLYIKRRNPTKIYYFSKQIPFTTIYLL